MFNKPTRETPQRQAIFHLLLYLKLVFFNSSCWDLLSFKLNSRDFLSLSLFKPVEPCSHASCFLPSTCLSLSFTLLWRVSEYTTQHTHTWYVADALVPNNYLSLWPLHCATTTATATSENVTNQQTRRTLLLCITANRSCLCPYYQLCNHECLERVEHWILAFLR